MSKNPEMNFVVLPNSGALVKGLDKNQYQKQAAAYDGGVKQTGQTLFQRSVGITDEISQEWAPWGAYNTEPQEFTRLAANNTIIPSLMEKKGALIAPEEPVVYRKFVNVDANRVEKQLIDSPAVEMWLNSISARNFLLSNAIYLAYSANVFTQFIPNRSNSQSSSRIQKLKALDYSLCQIKKDGTRFRFFPDWRTRGATRNSDEVADERVQEMTLVSIDEAIMDMDALRQRRESFVMHEFIPMPGSSYYGQPAWASAEPAIALSNNIWTFKNNSLDNAHSILFHITYYKDFAKEYLANRINPDTQKPYTQVEIQEWENEWWKKFDEELAGSANANKSFRTGVDLRPTGTAGQQELEQWFKIERVDREYKDEAYLSDIAQINQQITEAIGMHINTTSLAESTGMNSGSDQKTGFNIGEITRGLYRYKILRHLEIAMYFTFPEAFEQGWRLGFLPSVLVNDDRNNTGRVEQSTTQAPPTENPDQ